MQALTAPPRDHLTGQQVLNLITSSDLTVDVSCDLLAADLTVVDDLTSDLQTQGSVSWDSSDTANVHRDCQIVISRELQWGSDLIAPRMTLTADGISATFNLGVFCLTTPARPLDGDSTTFTVTGYDRLYLLQREVGDTYAAQAGSPVLDTVTGAITSAGLTGVAIDQTAAGVTIPTDMVWPLLPSDGGATTWLQIINTLLAVVGYDPLWADENGLYRSQPHLTLDQRPVEFTLDATDTANTIVGLTRSLTEDQWAAPNTWIFVQTGHTSPVEGDGQYTVVNQSDGPSSIDTRGIVWPRQYTLDAADQATLQQLGDAQVAADRTVLATFTVPSGPLPIAGHNDVIGYLDAVLGGTVKTQATAWSLPFDGPDMSWTLQAAG